jgi:hypothetical protein
MLLFGIKRQQNIGPDLTGFFNAEGNFNVYYVEIT